MTVKKHEPPVGLELGGEPSGGKDVFGSPFIWKKSLSATIPRVILGGCLGGVDRPGLWPGGEKAKFDFPWVWQGPEPQKKRVQEEGDPENLNHNNGGGGKSFDEMGAKQRVPNGKKKGIKGLGGETVSRGGGNAQRRDHVLASSHDRVRKGQKKRTGGLTKTNPRTD